MKRILFIAHTSDLGGPAYSLLKLLSHLKKEYSPFVYAPGNGNLFFELTKINVPFFPSPNNIGLLWYKIPDICKIINDNKIDLVYGNNFSAGARNGLIAAKIMHRPFIWHIREMVSRQHLKTALFLNLANEIIAVSKACAQSITKLTPNKSVEVVYNGIDIQDFSNSPIKSRSHLSSLIGDNDEQNIKILSVGHVCKRKGQECILKLTDDNTNNFTNKKIFIVVGRLDIDPDYANHLQEKSKVKNFEMKIRFLGSQDNMPMIYQGADIFLHTANKDPNPRVIIEAMASGLPVVAFDVDGLPEMVEDQKTGYLVPLGDIHAMNNAIDCLIADPKLRLRMGEAGNERAKLLFNAENTAYKINSIIERTFNNSRLS